MKVLAAVIIPPHLMASGAANAAKHLSAALADYCEIDLAILSYREFKSNFGKAKLLERKSSNILAFTKGLLPNKVRTLFYRADIPALIKKGGYDLVHLHNTIPALEAKRVAQTCVRQKIPYVISTHGFFEIASGGSAYSLKYIHEKLAWKFLLEQPVDYIVRHAQKIFALSPYEYPLLEKLGVEKERIAIVTNGISPEFLAPRHPEQIDSVIERLNLPKLSQKEMPVGIFLGNHTPNKGVEVLLEAFSQIKKPFILIVCGQKRDNIDYEGFLPNLSQEQRVIFTDWISYQDVISLFNYADLFVYPTLSDTLPLVILEAMASGLPILSTKVGGIPYQVDESCGVLVEPRNSQAVAAAFERMTQNQAELVKMGQAASQIAKTKFNWENSAQTAFELYQEVLTIDQTQRLKQQSLASDLLTTG